MRKNLFKILVYISLIFLVIKLVQADYLVIPVIYKPIHLTLSFIFLFAGMISNTLNWKAMLKQSDILVSTNDAVKSIGLAIFTKYIPGKVLMILGRAEYITQMYEKPINQTSAISLQTQFMSLWVGLGLGCIGLFLINGFENNQWIYLIVALWVLLSILAFLPLVKIGVEKIVALMVKKTINLPHLAFRKVMTTSPYFLLNWLLWSISFYFLTHALTQELDITLATGLAFPLAATIGIMAIIAPGGIGVREGVLAFYLSLTGFDVQEATTISVASRLWFLIGEIFLFMISFLNLSQKKVNPSA